jgi:dihydroorotate dehydrogenase electron transfer subunit
MIQERMKVLSQREIADGIYELILEGSLAGKITEPGQFVHVRIGDQLIFPLLRRPISICSVNPEYNRLTLIYRRTGVGTERLAKSRPGDRIDMLGPLGHGFPPESADDGMRALIIGGGVGVPPLYGLSQVLSDRGVQVTHVLGFRSRKDIFYEDEFAALGETVIVTEDGSNGRKGRVTDVLDKMDFDVAYACGPLPMLKAVSELITEKPLFLSLEQRMGCGVGACLACVMSAADKQDEKGYRRVCCDGPVFKAGEVKLC